MKKKIVFASRIIPDLLEKTLAAMPEVELTRVDGIAGAVPVLGGADALVIADPQAAEGAALAEGLRNRSAVKWVQIVSVGADGLLRHPLPAKLIVSNQGGVVAPTVAEYGMALLLGLTRGVAQGVRQMDAAQWKADLSAQVTSLAGKTMAIIGYGNIGRELARRAQAFGMKIIAVSRSEKADEFASQWFPIDDFHPACAMADVVAVTIAQSPQTEGAFSHGHFRSMKQGALFLNLSRGSTISTEGLLEALEAKRLAGAGLDVFDPEPPAFGHPIWSYQNVILSPHVGGAGGFRTREKILAMVEDNVRRFCRGEAVSNTVYAG